MGILDLTAGANAPEEFNVVIEIPMHAQPVKYEMDKDTGCLTVDRLMLTAMFYPANYGYIPATLSQDGDPCDVLVVTPVPLIAGSVVRCRALGMLKMSDEAGVDMKILAVPLPKIAPMYAEMTEHTQLPATLLAAIEHFFSHYKDLEKGKWVKIEGYADSAAAKQDIVAGIEKFKE
jgi:inorganic pyrophosphatase